MDSSNKIETAWSRGNSGCEIVVSEIKVDVTKPGSIGLIENVLISQRLEANRKSFWNTKPSLAEYFYWGSLAGIRDLERSNERMSMLGLCFFRCGRNMNLEICRSEISPKLSMFSISSDICRCFGGGGTFASLYGRINAGTYDSDSKSGINSYSDASPSRPEKCLAFMLGALALGGFIICIKGIYSFNDWLIFGGWIIAAVAVALGTIWIIVGHFPFDDMANVRDFPTLPPYQLHLSFPRAV